MEKYEIERLNSLPIESVASRLGLEVSYHKALCPFHTDKHPSLTFNTHRNRYRCFVCGASGGTIDLVMNILHSSFTEACRWLGSPSFQEEGKRINEKGKMDVSIPNSSHLSPNSFSPSRYSRFFEHPFLNEVACHFLFDQRHLDPRVVRWCRLNSYQDKQGIHWLQIPYYDIAGKLVGVQSRNLRPSKSSAPPQSPEQRGLKSCLGGLSAPRFRFPTGSKCSIYNLNVLAKLRPGESLYLCEGCSDCWSLLSAGHKAIAIPSATLLKPQDLAPIQELGLRLGLSFHMFPDQDEPGERLFLQIREQLPNIVRHSLPEGCKDYSDFFCKQTL